MSAQDAELLRKTIIKAGDGNYIEIGTLYGASAIFAVLVKRENKQKGWVYAIDPMTGYYGGDDGFRTVSVDDFYSNLEKFSAHVSLIREYSYPFPLNIKASVILIDGDHTLKAVKQDFESAKKYTNTIIFHDYNDSAIYDFVNSLMDWKITDSIKTMAVIERITNEN